MNTRSQEKCAHTPGPWKAAATGSSVVGIPIVGPNGRAITSLHWGSFHTAEPSDWDRIKQANAEQLANARLIAAAPDLFNAVRLLLDDGLECECGHVATCARCAAQAAIAKAEGRDRG